MQSIDSSVVHLKKVRSYNDSNGFVNFFDITGQLKSLDLGNNRIELLLSSRNPDFSIEIEVDPLRVANRFKVGDMITCSGFLRGDGDGGAWRLRFRAREVHEVSLTDLSGDALEDLIRRLPLPYPVPVVNHGERLATPEYRRAKAGRRNGNYVGLSGFVENMKFYPGEINDQGKKSADSVKILLRQFDDVKKSIMVELNGREARETFNGIGALSVKGFPFVRFHGEAYVKIKDVPTRVPVLDGDGAQKKDDQGAEVFETQTVRTIIPAIKAIAAVGIGKPHEMRQPKEVKDPVSGEMRVEYPYPWASVYLERAEAARQKLQRRGQPVAG